MFGEPVGPAHRVNASSVPMVLHLLLVLAAGISCRQDWSPGSSVLRSCSDEHLTPPCQSRRGHAAGPMLCPACDRRQRLAALAAGCAAACTNLCALGDGGANAHGLTTAAGPARHRPLQTSAGRYPSVAAHHAPRCARSAPCATSIGFSPSACPIPALARSRAVAGRQSETRTNPAAEGEGLHQIPVGPGPCRHHRPGHSASPANGGRSCGSRRAGFAQGRRG